MGSFLIFRIYSPRTSKFVDLALHVCVKIMGFVLDAHKMHIVCLRVVLTSSKEPRDYEGQLRV